MKMDLLQAPNCVSRLWFQRILSWIKSIFPITLAVCFWLVPPNYTDCRRVAAHQSLNLQGPKKTTEASLFCLFFTVFLKPAAQGLTRAIHGLMLINRNTEGEVEIIYLDIKYCTFKNFSRAKLIKMSSNNNVLCERTNDASFLLLVSEESESKTFGTKLFVLLPITLIWILTLVKGHGQRGNGAGKEKERNGGAGAGKNNQSQMRVICLSLRGTHSIIP